MDEQNKTNNVTSLFTGLPVQEVEVKYEWVPDGDDRLDPRALLEDAKGFDLKNVLILGELQEAGILMSSSTISEKTLLMLCELAKRSVIDSIVSD